MLGPVASEVRWDSDPVTGTQNQCSATLPALPRDWMVEGEKQARVMSGATTSLGAEGAGIILVFVGL